MSQRLDDDALDDILRKARGSNFAPSSAVLRSPPDAAAELGERLWTIARGIADAIAPSRLLLGHAEDDPGLLVFICDAEEHIDLPRYMGSSVRSAHLRLIGPLLIEPPRWYALDPTWRYFRGRQR